MAKSDPDDIASTGEVARALGALSQADRKRLAMIARARSQGLYAGDWQDLLQESIARALDGSRRWPRSVSIVAFIAQTMRSISSDLRKRHRETCSDIEAIADTLAPDCHRQVEASDMLARIGRRFARDADVLGLMAGLQLGETAQETQLRFGLNAAQYDAARKRFWRGVAAISETVDE